jgi:hypothetical protein
MGMKKVELKDGSTRWEIDYYEAHAWVRSFEARGSCGCDPHLGPDRWTVGGHLYYASP